MLGNDTEHTTQRSRPDSSEHGSESVASTWNVSCAEDPAVTRRTTTAVHQVSSGDSSEPWSANTHVHRLVQSETGHSWKLSHPNP